MKIKKDDRFGNLRVIAQTDKRNEKNGEIIWQVKCELCGTVKEMKTSDLKRCRSCGCKKGRPKKNQRGVLKWEFTGITR
jgi:rubrerythrin